jgi:hypothetical protein
MVPGILQHVMNQRSSLGSRRLLFIYYVATILFLPHISYQLARKEANVGKVPQIFVDCADPSY